MPRVSKTELQLRQAIDALSKIGLDENQPTYIRRPALSAIVRHGMDIRKHKAEEAAKKAERDKANRPNYSVLPSNGREPPPDWKPTQAQPFRIPPGINRG
jgi:hypothetical protein